MLDFVIHLIPTIIMLGILIFVHELGHFLACRIAGVAVEKFSIGFGPELLSWCWGQTRYALSAVPFGGFVKPQGETSEEIESRGGTSDPRDFLTASAWNRFVILAAGVSMNFILAYVLLVFVMTTGRVVPAPVIGGFIKNLPAASSSLKIGDEVTQVNGKAVRSWQDLTMNILSSAATPLRLTVKRGESMLELTLEPKIEEGRDIFGQIARVPHLGIMRGDIFRIEKYSVGQAFLKAFSLEMETTALTVQALLRLATGRLSPKALVGPIGIVSMTGSAAKMGFSALIQLAASLSISLAVINLLPIPALDGGHIFFLLIEVIRRKPVSLKVQERVTQFGFYFLMFLMVLVVFNDLSNMGALAKIKSVFFS